MTRSISTLCMSAFVIVFLVNSSTHGQQTPTASGASEAQILQDLVTEVRQLRFALERTTSVNSRMQVTLQRIQLQQKQFSRVASQLESIRDGIRRLEAEQADMSNHTTDVESRIEQEQNPDKQKQLQDEQKQMKLALDQKERLIQDERTRESELSSRLEAEQSRLSELQANLDSLEKRMEAEAAH